MQKIRLLIDYNEFAYRPQPNQIVFFVERRLNPNIEFSKIDAGTPIIGYTHDDEEFEGEFVVIPELEYKISEFGILHKE